MTKKEKAILIIEQFDKLYPKAVCSLDYTNPLELLIATQLAAQCTDERVNIVTKELFEKYRNAEDFAGADISELEQDIKSTGFFRNKAKNIKACCMRIITEYNGKVPNNMTDLLTLPGVGRKTANVVLGAVYSIPGIVVDTHFKRLSYRMGFTQESDPEKIEKALMKIIPKDRWTLFSHQMVYHGRNICNARKPKCGECLVLPYCNFGQKNIK